MILKRQSNILILKSNYIYSSYESGLYNAEVLDNHNWESSWRILFETKSTLTVSEHGIIRLSKTNGYIGVSVSDILCFTL